MVGLSGNRTAAGVIWSTSCSPLGWGSLWRGNFYSNILLDVIG